MAKITKRDLTIRISNETGLIQQKVLTIIDLTLDHLIESLAQGRTVEFRKFGVFELRRTKARVGRNPNRPEKPVPIPPRTVVKFKAGKQLEAQVNHAQLTEFLQNRLRRLAPEEKGQSVMQSSIANTNGLTFTL